LALPFPSVSYPGGAGSLLGGWTAAKTVRGSAERIKSDERMLGDGDFVEAALQKAQEGLERRYALMAVGVDLQTLAERVGQVLGTDDALVWNKGKNPAIVRARSLFCYWAVRELGCTNRALAEKLGLTQPAVSISVRRGERIAAELSFQHKGDKKR